MKYYIPVNTVSLKYCDSMGENLQKTFKWRARLDDSVGEDIYKQT